MLHKPIRLQGGRAKDTQGWGEHSANNTSTPGEVGVLVQNQSSIDQTPVLLQRGLQPTAIASMGPQFLHVNYHLPHH